MTTQFAFDQEKVDFSLPVNRKYYRLSKKLSRELYTQWRQIRFQYEEMEAHFLSLYQGEGLVHKFGRIIGFYVKNPASLPAGFIAEPHEMESEGTVYLISLDVRQEQAKACQAEIQALNQALSRAPDIGPFIVQQLELGQHVTVSLGPDGKPLTHCAVAGLSNKGRLLLSVPYGGGFHLSDDHSSWANRHFKRIDEETFLAEAS